MRARRRCRCCNLISSGRFVMLCVALQWVKMSNEKRNKIAMLCICATENCITAYIRRFIVEITYCVCLCISSEWHRIHFAHDGVVVRYACPNLGKREFELNVVVRHTSVCIQSHYVFRCIMLFIDSPPHKTHVAVVPYENGTTHSILRLLPIHMRVHISLAHFN